jgi:hypothetical protein
LSEEEKIPFYHLSANIDILVESPYFFESTRGHEDCRKEHINALKRMSGTDDVFKNKLRKNFTDVVQVIEKKIKI